MLKRAACFLFALTLFVAPSFGDTLKLNKEKSRVEFVGKKSDGKHSGGFKEFKVDAKADFEDPSKSSIAITIDTNSLFSDDAKLTEHLKNPDFFNVKKYDTIKFESTKIEHADEKATIVGKLTMLDKTVEVRVPAKVEMTDDAITLVADFKIDRNKWGMSYGKGKINDEVDITAVLSFKR